MADVFLSYAREDQDRIADLVDALEGRGWSVWWDRQLRPGARYEDVIEKELGSARCVVVALTEAALTSAYVRSEAAEARDRGILLPALLDDVRVPLSMNQTQCADLRDWPKDDRGLVSLLTSVADLTDEVSSTRLPSLFGREPELEALSKQFLRAERRRGGLVLLNGEPGIGKTALTDQFTSRLPTDSALVVAGQCYDEQGAPSYSPWVQILNQVLAEVPPTEALLADADLLLAAMSGLDLAYEVSPATLVDRSSMPAGAEYLADVRHRMFEAAAAYLMAAADGKPLVIVLEDVHWADQATLRLLEFLARRITDSAVLLLATYRDVEVRRDHPLFDSLARLNRLAGVQRMRLAGLSEEDVAALLAERLPIRLPPGLAATVFQHTEGNPFFVRELIEVIAGELTSSPEGPIEVHIPEGVRETIGHRLNRLSETCNQVLSMASVLGLEFRQAE
ncbi:MAG: AAA family ATPase, partial [Gammaproteobacteria bacterium]